MKLIDTNVFVYANGSEHEYKEPCVGLLSTIALNRVAANVDVELFQEVMHYYHSRRNLDLALPILDDLHVGFPNPFTITSGTIKLATTVLAQYPQLESRDAVHAAVVIENGLEGIISADRGFEAITGIERFDPKEF